MEDSPTPQQLPNPTPSSDGNDYTLGTVCHLLGLVGYLGVPFGSVIGPLVLWLVKKAEDPFLDKTGRHVLNFQISLVIYLIVATLSVFVVIGFILVPAVLIFGLVYTIIGAIKASEGEVYCYPLTIQFIKS